MGDRGDDGRLATRACAQVGAGLSGVCAAAMLAAWHAVAAHPDVTAAVTPDELALAAVVCASGSVVLAVLDVVLLRRPGDGETGLAAVRATLARMVAVAVAGGVLAMLLPSAVVGALVGAAVGELLVLAGAFRR